MGEPWDAHLWAFQGQQDRLTVENAGVHPPLTSPPASSPAASPAISQTQRPIMATATPQFLEGRVEMEAASPGERSSSPVTRWLLT